MPIQLNYSARAPFEPKRGAAAIAVIANWTGGLILTVISNYQSDKLHSSMKSDVAGLERLLRPLSQRLTADLARALINLSPDPETQARYDMLAEKRNEGSLTSLEEEELESLVRANTFLGLLKAEARSVLSHIESA